MNTNRKIYVFYFTVILLAVLAMMVFDLNIIIKAILCFLIFSCLMVMRSIKRAYDLADDIDTIDQKSFSYNVRLNRRIAERLESIQRKEQEHVENTNN